jgi:predicted CxxxxCH...CXXCH cytochrome family protein
MRNAFFAGFLLFGLPAAVACASVKGGSDGSTDPNADAHGSANGTSATSSATPNGGMTCAVAAMFAKRCVACHSNPPVGGAPMPLVTFADLMAPSKQKPEMNEAQLALARIQSGTLPMPPAFTNNPVSPQEVTALEEWVGGGYQGTCDPDAGAQTEAGAAAPPPPPGAGVPCDVQTVLNTKCLQCHGSPPTPGALVSLSTVADLLAPSKQSPSQNEAQWSITRMQSATSPMPPASFHVTPTASDIAAFQAWAGANWQGSCGDAGAPPPPATLTCTSCHGDPTRVAGPGVDPNVMVAPPMGTHGETATSASAVGAHMAHLAPGASAISNPIACTECHRVPTDVNHSNGGVDMVFGVLATSNNAAPLWNGTTCASAYCHGDFSGGNTTAAPVWTGGPMTCTSCHGGPPATGKHIHEGHGGACSNCHGAGYTSSAVNIPTHVNGTVEVGGTGSSIKTWNASTLSCTPTCHGTEHW